MNKFLKSIVSVVSALSLAATLCGWSVKQPNEEKEIDLSNMKLVFEDEFDGEIDSSVWDITSDNGVRRGGYWDSEQCFTQDGRLIIRTEYKEDGNYGAGWYTGTCKSKGLKDFKYGYYEVSCKAPAAEGLWSAFWMLCDSMGEVTGDGKNGCEIGSSLVFCAVCYKK